MNELIQASLQVVQAHLREHDVTFHVHESEAHVVGHFRLDQFTPTFWFQLDEEAHRALLIVRYPVHIPSSARRAMFELFGLANWKLGTGYFCMDPSDGEIQFRVGAGLGNTPMNRDMVEDWFRNAASVVSGMHEAIMAVGFSGQDPAVALEPTGLGTDDDTGASAPSRLASG